MHLLHAHLCFVEGEVVSITYLLNSVPSFAFSTPRALKSDTLYLNCSGPLCHMCVVYDIRIVGCVGGFERVLFSASCIEHDTDDLVNGVFLSLSNVGSSTPTEIFYL